MKKRRILLSTALAVAGVFSVPGVTVAALTPTVAQPSTEVGPGEPGVPKESQNDEHSPNYSSEDVFVYKFSQPAIAKSTRAVLGVGTLTNGQYLALRHSDYIAQKGNIALSGLVPERAVIMTTQLYGTDDPGGTDQWSLGGDPSTSGIRWEAARSLGLTLLKTPRVAVLDTGWTVHPDLPTPAQQYDFISDSYSANDGGGRDSSALDPGDPCGSSSSWHGTMTAGEIAAINNNGVGLIGVLPSVELVVARVLGRCGGTDYDIADAIRWAAGGSVSGVPSITKVDVINMSLGGLGACNSYVQDAVTFARNQGVVVVAAAGNETVDATTSSPVNCLGVLGVGASGLAPSLSSYSNFGHNVALLAPGGDGANRIMLLSNAGTSSPSTPNYSSHAGTSMAAPYVAAAAAYIRAVAPSTTVSQIAYLLEKSAVPYSGGVCATVRTCGAGLLDLAAALALTTSMPSLESDLTLRTTSIDSSVTRVGSSWDQGVRYGYGSYFSSGTRFYMYSDYGSSCYYYCYTKVNWSADLPSWTTVNLTVQLTGSRICFYYGDNYGGLSYDSDADGNKLDWAVTPYTLTDSSCSSSGLWDLPFGDVSGLGSNSKMWFTVKALENYYGEAGIFIDQVKFNFSGSQSWPFWSAPPYIRASGSTVGSSLTAGAGAWGGGTTLGYQWKRCTTGSSAASCASISGASGTTYALATADLGKEIRLEVSATNSAGTVKWMTPATATVAAAAANTSAPAVSGTLKVGSTLTGSQGSWSGTPTPTYGFVWARCSATGSASATLPGTCTLIDGATSSTYVLASADYSNYLRLGVTATNSAGSATMYSAATAIIAGGLPANTLAPSISGTAKVATQLTGSSGTWGGYPAPSETYAYAWFSCTSSGSASATLPSKCTAISGATTNIFTPTSTQVGKYLRLKVTATSTAGSTFYFSAATAKVIR